MPYRKGNKHDYNDAQAIAEASKSGDMRFVPLRSLAQQDVQLIHRIRERRVAHQTALGNQLRGLMAEYGIIFPKGVTKILALLPEVLEDDENGSSQTTCHQFQG